MHPALDIAVFVRTVDLGTFTAVGHEVGLTSSGVSRIVSRLETRLGAKLFHRSTRRLVLTEEGATFLDHARGIIAALEAAEADVASSHGRVRGRIRVNTGTAITKHKLVPLLSRFMSQHPEVAVELTVTDRRIDPVADQIDVTIRVGPLADSDLVGVELGTVARVIAAAPDYLRRRGTPRRPRDLLEHDCLMLTGVDRLAEWPLFENGKRTLLPVDGSFRSDNAEALHDMAVAGLGIVRLGDFLGEAALAKGRLVPLLAECHDSDPQPITALVLPGRQRIPRIRRLIDCLKAGFAQRAVANP